MNDLMYKHVLFKDLKDYLKRTEYFEGYTPTEQSWIKKNLGLIGEKEVELLLEKERVVEVTLSELNELISKKDLSIGSYYLIKDFPLSPAITLAYSQTGILQTVYLLNLPLYECKFDLSKIVYLKDENQNEGDFDFITAETFTDREHCFNNKLFNTTNIKLIGECNNNILEGTDIQIEHSSGIVGKAENISIKDFSDDYLKQIIVFENKYYLDYLDLETLTHQFYAIDALH